MKLRKKIILGVLCLSVVLGAGAAFANTSAGGQLKAWYNNRLQIAKDNIKRTLESHITWILPGIDKEAEARKGESAYFINSFADTTIGYEKDIIMSVAEGYIEDIKNTQGKITKGMPGDFKDYVDELDKEMKPHVDKKGDEILKQLADTIKTEGKKGKDKVTHNLNDVKTAAVAELKRAIEQAKKELQDLINKEIIASNENTKANLAKQIDEKRTEINNVTEKLEEIQFESIRIKGAQIEKEAIKELDKLIGDF